MKMELKSPSASESGHISEILNSQIMMFSNRFYPCLWHSQSKILSLICTCGNIFRFPLTTFLPSQWMLHLEKLIWLQGSSSGWTLCSLLTCYYQLFDNKWKWNLPPPRPQSPATYLKFWIRKSWCSPIDFISVFDIPNPRFFFQFVPVGILSDFQSLYFYPANEWRSGQNLTMFKISMDDG